MVLNKDPKLILFIFMKAADSLSDKFLWKNHQSLLMILYTPHVNLGTSEIIKFSLTVVYQI